MADGIQKKYAIIINGDDADRHLANVDRAVESLKSAGDYQINVVSPTHPKEKDVNYLPASIQALDQVITGLGTMDDDDLLVIYVTGHGDEEANGEGLIVLPDGPLSLEKLGANLNRLSYGRRLFFMDQCYGANGIDQFANSKTSILTAGSKGEAVQCSRFSGSFWNLGIPDNNNDGVITIQERYDYAAVQDPLFASVSQYLNPTDEISLSGQSVDGPWPKEVKEVNSRSELEAETSKLQHGQLALVVFSADWCGACHEFAPKFAQLAEKYNGRYQMLRLEGRNGSEKEWSKHYQLEGFPSVSFIDSDGKVTNVPLELRSDPEQYLAKAVAKTDEDQVAAFSRKILFGDAEKRKKAIYTIDQNFLKSLNDHSSQLIEPLVACLHDPNPQIQTAALIALRKFGNQAAPAWNDIVQCLSSEDSQVRVDALNALGTIPQKATQSVPIILKHAKDENMYVRYSAALALENLGDIKNAVIVLCDLAKDKKARGMSLFHLETMGPKAKDAVPTLLPLLDSSERLVTRLLAIQALGGIGRPNYRKPPDPAFADLVAPHLIACLDDPDERIRSKALSALYLSQIKSPVLVEKYQALLTDNDMNLAVGAADGLGDCGEAAKSAVPDLIESAKHGQTLELQIHSALALSFIDPKNRNVFGVVKHVIKNTQPSVEQVQLALALYRMDDDQAAIRYLRKNLNVSDGKTQQAALQAVEKMGAKAAPLIPELVALTYGSDPGLTMGVIQAFRYIGPDAKMALPRLQELSQQKSMVGQFAQQALEEILP